MNTNRIGRQKVMRRFKWMCLTCVIAFTFQYVIESCVQHIQVEAGSLYFFEDDDVFNSYVKSATF